MIKPQAPVRRFDVFAEYKRQSALKQGTPPAEAKGYGLWVAKVVAARRFGRTPKPPGKESRTERKRPAAGTKWHALDGKPQTDKLFDREIVQRMGNQFYSKVFVPAIHKAIQKGEKYPVIRDAIRRDWKP
jgi:hypothetical protein